MTRRTDGLKSHAMPASVIEMQAAFLAQNEVYLDAAARRLGYRVEKGRGIDGKSPVKAAQYVWADPEKIERRTFLYGRSMIRKYLMVTVAPGGVGKSSLAIVEAIAMATGVPLLGHRVDGKLRVWYWNLEDPFDELQRRIQAVCLHYNIGADDIGDRLFVTSGRDHPICIAVQGKQQATVNRTVVDALVVELRANKIDVLVIDPFVSSHAVAENDNSAMDRVAKVWSEIAERAEIGVHLIHHTRKMGPDSEVSTESARGGKALTDAAREVRAINRMSVQEGDKFGIENHRQYFKCYSDKANLAPPPEHTDWYRIENVELPNGDHVGVVVKWEPPTMTGSATVLTVSDADLLTIQRKIELSVWRYSAKADHWAGEAVADVLGIDLMKADARKQVARLIDRWIEAGHFKIEKRTIDSKNRVPFLEVSRWVM